MGIKECKETASKAIKEYRGSEDARSKFIDKTVEDLADCIIDTLCCAKPDNTKTKKKKKKKKK